MTKPVLPFLETMITYNCNLSCRGCTNYSDYTMKGLVRWEQGKKWLEKWLQRIAIPDFGIIGGEPLLSPDVNAWILGCRQLMPESQIRFTTNATLLKKKWSVVEDLLEIGNCVLKLSIHQPDQFYTQEILNDLFRCVSWSPVEEHGIKRWIGPNQVRLQLNFPNTFVKTYQNEYKEMMPHNNTPDDAFNICVQQKCPLLYEGKIYKCSTSGLLQKVLEDWNRTGIPEWQSYLNYTGIDATCSDADLQDFILGFGNPESICSMCPSTKDKKSHLHHVTNVIAKSGPKNTYAN